MKTTQSVRKDGRTALQLRSVKVTYDFYAHAAGSVLLEVGNTKILCAVSLQNGVPQFLRGKGVGGWLTAEYALLPMATATRTQRESTQGRKDGRSIEISRFIGRCFRSVVDLSVFGEKTITLDCDVLQADGGTRTASITGAFLALMAAQNKWLASRVIERPFIKENITAVSVGVVHNDVLLDLNYDEDSVATADFNFVMSESDKIIEMQGGAESSPLSWQTFEDVRIAACSGAQQLFALYDDKKIIKKVAEKSDCDQTVERVPLFSLKNRQNSSQ